VISSASEVDAELDRAVALWSETALDAPDRLYEISVPYNFSSTFVTANPDIIAQGEERLSRCPPEFFPALARLVEAFRDLDITTELGRIECPTLVLVGEEDALKPVRYSRLIAERIPQSELLVIPDAGHAVILEKPQEVNTALLGFIEKHCRAEQSS
jgi:3-oxoadipate enol-lactonase